MPGTLPVAGQTEGQDRYTDFIDLFCAVHNYSTHEIATDLNVGDNDFYYSTRAR